METQLLSLSKIFSERIFRIPDYQRGYAWNEKHFKDYWNDLVLLPRNRNHYVGVLTLEKVPQDKYKTWEDDFWIMESKNYTPFYIVDGQQRLTTTIILLQVILETINDRDKINYTTREEIRKKFIYDSKDDGISKSFLFGYEKDNPSYEFLKIKILNEKSETNFTLQETTYTYNLEQAKQFFINNLKDKSLKEIEVLYTKLTQNFLFNIFTISSDIDVFVAFETMNNRGKPLSYLELLKNRLIYLSTQFNESFNEREKLRKNINECWKDIYKLLGMNKLNPLDDDEFLANHFIIYYGKEINEKQENPKPNYLSQIRRIRRMNFYQSYLLDSKFIKKNINNSNFNGITIPEINNYVKSLKESVKYWYFIHNPHDSEFNNAIKEYLHKLNRMGFGNDSSLIMVFLQEEKNEKIILEFLYLMEKYTFLLSLHTGVIYRSDMFNSLQIAEKLFNKEITTKEVNKKIQDYINKLLSDKENNDRVIQRFKKEGFYDWSDIKYFLFEYELYLKSQSKNERDKIQWNEYAINDYKTIEHIYPQKPRDNYWSTRFNKFTSKEKNILKNTLGNLVPISKEKNSSLSNKPFPEKKGNDKSMVGYKYGSYSEIELTNYFEWTSKEILERGLKLLKFLEKRWEFKVTDKVDFLGLSFLIKK